MPDESKLTLEIAYFVAKNRIFFKRMVVFFLFFVDVVLVAVFSTGFINYQTETLVYQEQLRQLSQNYIDYEYLRSLYKPQPLEVVKTHVIRNNKGSSDFVALIKNVNDDWRATSLEYRFISDRGASDYLKSFVLPGQEKYLMVFNSQALKNSASFRVDFRNIAWQRVDSIENLARLNDLQATGEKIEILPDGSSVLKFNATNPSAYGFWTVGWQVVVFRQARAVAANQIFVENLKARDSKEVVLIWLERLETSDKIDIRPDVDVYQENVFMNPNLID